MNNVYSTNAFGLVCLFILFCADQIACLYFSLALNYFQNIRIYSGNAKIRGNFQAKLLCGSDWNRCGGYGLFRRRFTNRL